VGAGLPEGYAEELSANRRLCNAVAKFAHDGWPVVAEGVALPWLGRDFDGRPMCAVLDASATTGDQTVAGYREATAPTASYLAPAGARITGYKQHRAIVTPRAGAVPAWTWSGGNPEGFVWRQVHASQLGLHWAAAPEIAKRLVAAAIAGPGPKAQPAPLPMPVAGSGPRSRDEPPTISMPAAALAHPASPAQPHEQLSSPAAPHEHPMPYEHPVSHEQPAPFAHPASAVPHEHGGPFLPPASAVPHELAGPFVPPASAVPHDHQGPFPPVVSGATAERPAQYARRRPSMPDLSDTADITAS